MRWLRGAFNAKHPMTSIVSVSIGGRVFLRHVLLLTIALLCLALSVPASLGAETAAAGVITGQVSNAATSAFLEGADVSVEGTAVSVTTDRQGRYELSLPPGVATLVVRYTGLEPQRLTVNVRPGGQTEQNVELSSGLYKMEAFTVSGPREGSAYAITKQRDAMNVKNVVSSDSFGNIADGNIGDLLQQLPGITAVYVGADVRSVQIRGIDGALNSVTMDGDQVASSQSAGLGRTFEFEQASLNNIETIEVTKAPTPDMDANSISGNVNIISKSAFDRAGGRIFNYSIGGVWRPKYYTRSDNLLREPIDNVGPSLNFSYADRLGAGKNVGITLNATYHSQPGGDTAALMNYQNVLTDPYYTYSVNVPRPAGAPRTRLATGAKVEYRLSPRTTFALNTTYNWFHETNDTRSMTLSTSQAVANFRPGYTNDFSEILANNNAVSTIALTTDDKSGRTWLISPSARHRFPGLEIDYSASLSNSQTYYEYAPGGQRHFDSRPKGAISFSLRNIGWTVDRRESLQWPKINQTTGADMYDLNNYGTMLLTQNDRGGEDEVLGARLNIKKTIELPVPTFVKIGGNIREQNRRLYNFGRRYRYGGPDLVQNNADDRLGQFLDLTGKWSDSNQGYRPPPWGNPFAISRHAAEHPEQWIEDTAFANTQRLTNDRTITETVTAGYIMGQTRINNLSILAGLRAEKTETDAEGPLQVGGAFVGRQRRKGDYLDVFPGVHFRYSPTRNIVSRLSYSSSIGRPSFDQLIPLDTVNEVSQFVTIRNSALKPQYSENFDAGFEYYFEPVGMFSASVFLKEITDFQFSDTSQRVGAGPDNGYGGLYENFEIRTMRNGGSARYRGWEVAYQQQFTFLPGFWRGFGFSANYTSLSTRGDYGGTVATTQLANFVPRAGNVAISYLGSGWNIRLNGVWRDTYLVGISTNAALLRYQQPKLQINLKTKYSISRTVSIFCDIENLNKSPITETYWGREDRPAETRIVVAKVVAGVMGRF